MRALAITRFGGPDALQLLDVPEPTPSSTQLLIRTCAAGLNPVDALQREGTFKVLQPYTFPKIVGNELSGVVAHVGSAVQGFAVGDRVIARTGARQLSAVAELVAVDAAFCAKAPEHLELAYAAVLPLAGLTAQQALGADHLDLHAGERLLITGAAGGVGLLAIQLAKRIGAHVTVTASPAGAELVRRLGADEVVNYRERSVADGGERFDKVLDLVGGDELPALLGIINRGGRLVTLSGPPTPGSLSVGTSGARKVLATVVEQAGSAKIRTAARRAGVSYEFFLMHPDGAGLAELSALVDAGELELVVDSRFTLDEYAAAFERLESHRAKGKVLITL